MEPSQYPRSSAAIQGLPYKHWKMEDLPWDRLDPSKVSPDLLKVIKAAALVEYNANAYADYLCKIFHDDPDFQSKARYWATEEVQHGASLGAWAEQIDPTWSLEKAMVKFRAGYSPEHFINTQAQSVRGSRAGEMVSRCMVETGTSSYYSAIGDSCEEPVLKEICRNIAGDEFRHYKTFYDTLNRYLQTDRLNKVQRLKVALGRIAETEDDELSYAYFAANSNDSDVYDRQTSNIAYMSRAYGFYRPKHLDRAVSMIFKACGLKPHTMPYKVATKLAWWQINRKAEAGKKMAAAA